MPNEKPSKLGFPFLADIDLAHSLDFHIAATNFTNTIDDFSEYLVLTYLWNIVRNSPDPITAEAEFYRDLNNNVIDFTKIKGVKSDENVLYDTIDLDSYLKPNEVWIRGKNGVPVSRKEQFNTNTTRTFYKALNLETDLERWVEYVPPLASQYSTINDLLTDNEQWLKGEDGLPLEVIKNNLKFYQATDTVTGKTRNVRIPDVEYDTLTNTINQKITALSTKYGSTFGAEKMSDEFLLFWYERFQKSHNLVKQEYAELIKDKEYTQDHFQEFNDSIGALGRNIQYPDTSTIPVWDITFKMSVLNKEGKIKIPKTCPPQVLDKLDDDIKFLLLDASKTVNSLFRLNITHAIDGISTVSTAHGTNLMTDHLHHVRMSLRFSDIAGIISDTLGVTYRIMNYADSALNKQETVNPHIHYVVENHKIRVDQLQRKINNLTKVTTINNMLKSTSSDSENDG
mgnify:FL=1